MYLSVVYPKTHVGNNGNEFVDATGYSDGINDFKIEKYENLYEIGIAESPISPCDNISIQS